MVQRIERPEHVGANHDPGGQIAEHGADPEKTAQGRGNRGGGQKDRDLNKLRLCHIRRIASALGVREVRSGNHSTDSACLARAPGECGRW